jgi:hypothetical protein
LLDNKLSWKPHLEERLLNTCRIFGQCRRAIGRTWGLKPKCIHWIYTRVVRPYLLYGSLFWFNICKQVTVQRQLCHLQRMACMSITGAMITTPTAALEVILNLRPLHIEVEAEARKTALRLHVMKQWNERYENSGHSKLWLTTTNYDKFLLAPCDRTSKVTCYNGDFQLTFPTDEQWEASFSTDDLAIFTYGSVGDRGAGLGVVCQPLNVEVSTPLGGSASFIQTTILSITTAVQCCLSKSIRGKNIKICSYSRAALELLTKHTFDSKMMLECRDQLRRLTRHNHVTLTLIPELKVTRDASRAEVLAKQARNVCPEGPGPFIPTQYNSMRDRINNWSLKEHVFLWTNIKTCRESKRFMEGPLIDQGDFLLSLSKVNLQKLCGVLTGHCRLNKHLTLIKIKNDATCEACMEDDESSFHVLAECPAYSWLRAKVFNKTILNETDMKSLSPKDLLRFIIESGRFEGLGLD